MHHASPSIVHAIGHTPVLQLPFPEFDRTITAKCEFLNPSGSIKDRLARTVIDDAERRGLLNPESIILECSSGNTGVAFAMQGAARGYRVKIVLSEVASHERRHLIEQLGGEVITFPGHDYGVGVALTRRIAAADPRHFLPRQFENPLNALDHEMHTASELLAQVTGRIDAFVAGYGTGGTLAGMSRALRRVHPSIRICAMEPAEAALMLGECSCAHSIEGIADGFIPELLKDVAIDEVLTVPSEEALRMTKQLTRRFGLLVGTSSGANVVAALRLARRLGPEANVVTLLCDRAERYFSTPLFHAAGAETPIIVAAGSEHR
jgi:cysteine synthase A